MPEIKYTGKKIARILLRWVKHHKRSFPWRKTRNPYKILIAEVMLQRTKASQVAKLYPAFLKKYRTPAVIAKTPLKKLERDMGPLGLHWRAANLRKLAVELQKKYKGKVPASRTELISLPAIGDYIADALLCFAYGKDIAIIDANVVRVLRRLFLIRKVRGEARRDKAIKKLAQQMIPRKRAHEYNWALLDFANKICLPRSPRCDVCQLKDLCKWDTSRNKKNLSKSAMLKKYGF